METELTEEMVNLAASTAHEVNRAYCRAFGDDSQVPWSDAPEDIKESARVGVRQIWEDPSTSPEASHESWSAQKVADGWVYGPVKDAEKKTHPCLVDFDDLPVAQRTKDYLFGVTVRGVLGLELFVETGDRRFIRHVYELDRGVLEHKSDAQLLGEAVADFEDGFAQLLKDARDATA